jgi:hypothetical protein
LPDPFFFLELVSVAIFSERLLTFTEVARVGTVSPLLSVIEVIQPNVDTNSLTCGTNFLCPFYVDAKLAVVAIGPTHNPDSLDLVRSIEVQITD